MIGSSSTPTSSSARRKAVSVAISNARGDESVSCHAPSTTLTFRSATGKPARTPARRPMARPASTPARNGAGMPGAAVSKLQPAAGSKRELHARELESPIGAALLVCRVDLDGSRDCFAIGDLRSADTERDVGTRAQGVDRFIELRLAGAAEDDQPPLGVDLLLEIPGIGREGRHETRPVARVARLDGDLDQVRCARRGHVGLPSERLHFLRRPPAEVQSCTSVVCFVFRIHTRVSRFDPCCGHDRRIIRTR